MASIKKFDLTLKDAMKVCNKYGLDKPSNIVRFEKGMVNDVFSLDQKYVIKIETGELQKPRFHKEKSIYDILKKKDIPCPKTYAFDNSKEIIPYSYILMEHVKGNTLSEVFPKLSTATKNDILKKLGKLLAKIHSIHFSSFGETFSNWKFIGYKTYREYLNNYIHLIAKELAHSEVLSPDKIKQIIDYFENNKDFNLKIKGSLLHGNFIYDNIIVQNNNIKAIVDWEWAKSGHNQEEVATFLYRTLKMEEIASHQFREGYEEIKKIDQKFQKRLYSYSLLYYLRVLPSVPQWTHHPDKQKEYFEETEKLFKKVIK